MPELRWAVSAADSFREGVPHRTSPAVASGDTLVTGYGMRWLPRGERSADGYRESCGRKQPSGWITWN